MYIMVQHYVQTLGMSRKGCQLPVIRRKGSFFQLSCYSEWCTHDLLQLRYDGPTYALSASIYSLLTWGDLYVEREGQCSHKVTLAGSWCDRPCFITIQLTWVFRPYKHCHDLGSEETIHAPRYIRKGPLTIPCPPAPSC